MKKSDKRGKKRAGRSAHKNIKGRINHRKARTKGTAKKRGRSRQARKDQNCCSNLDFVPFAIAIIVAVIVVMQSIQSARELRSTHGAASFHAPTYRMAGGCTVDGDAYRQIKTLERAVSRALERGEAETVKNKINELKEVKIEACL